MEQAILTMIERYRHAISTQEAEDFLPLWDRSADCTLISPSHSYTGIDAIYNDFLLGAIRHAYSRIDLVTENIDVRILGDCAVVIFAYATDCIRRDTGEPFGISGLETQVYRLVEGDWKLVHVHYSLNKKA